MKRTVKISVCVALLLALACAFSGCFSKNEIIIPESTLNSYSLRAVDMNGNECAASLSGSNDETVYVDLLFGQVLPVNSVSLSEAGGYVTAFNIYALNGEEKTLVYSQESIGQWRECSFETVEADGVRVEVTASRSKFEITNIKAACITDERPFCLTKFISLADAYDINNIKSRAASITDCELTGQIIITDAVTFDETGKVTVTSSFAEQNGMTGEAVLQTAVNNIKQAVGEADISVGVMISSPLPEKDTANFFIPLKKKGDVCVRAYQSGNLVLNINNLTEQFDLGAVVLKWDYPATKKQWSVYDEMILSLKRAEPSTELSVAVGDYNVKLSSEALNALDSVILMAQDMKTQSGNHTAYEDTLKMISRLHSNGCELLKIQLAISSYARDSQLSGVIYPYKDEAYKLGKGKNSVGDLLKGTLGTSEFETQDERFYNGYTMVFDKAAYAYDCGLYGVALYDYCGDLPYYDELSLAKAVDSAVNSRKADINSGETQAAD